MQIKYTNRFQNEFIEIYKFIFEDSPTQADIFRKELKEKIDFLLSMPFIYRQSIKSEDINVRDLIFKKYVIPYKVKKDEILILGIFAQNRWKIK
jgi:plasmid stabilization system protein ParE